MNPLYKFPSLYNDIAVIELGRRIEYDFEKFGDSPACMDQGDQDTMDKIATIRSKGALVTGRVGHLHESNVSVISNQLCQEYFTYNGTLDTATKRAIQIVLPQGLNDGLLCSQGHVKEEGHFTGACKGDGGAPLTSLGDLGKQTLIGVVSGGSGCGKGVPNWHSKVSFFYPWIDCVIQTSKSNRGNVNMVRERCDKVAADLLPVTEEESEYFDDTVDTVDTDDKDDFDYFRFIVDLRRAMVIE